LGKPGIEPGTSAYLTTVLTVDSTNRTSGLQVYLIIKALQRPLIAHKVVMSAAL